MEMQQVRYFVTLAKTLNFTRAAEQCNVSQPALTRAIQQLEHELGGPLFHRERNNTHLSELGLMMLPYLEGVEESSRAAKEAAKSVRKLENVTLTLGAMCTIGPQLVADLIVRFQAENPDVAVQVVDGEARAMIERLEKGDLHISLVGVPEELPEQFHQVPVFSEKFVIVLPPDHPFAKKEAIRVAELDGQPYVGRSNCEVFQFVTDDFMRRGVTTRKVFSSPRDEWVQNMIKAGLGFGFFPEFAVTDPELVSVPLIEPGYSRTIYLATVRGRPHSPAVGAFVKAARGHAWPVSELSS
ncbi:LysR family transcriptional regulator [Altererythrobacter salegens]|uniref:LysR family transcriptional regulator n=1 Tax=Croceibacterium salegens TaxID=1737568 RepID=A0A6I4T1S8_9SPHN|nr:LysR family transcriptional regulator [Croceibacterium salegens]MXO61280.1 LysR family transcriptional regulator [Croceibacterium salegens]